MPQPHVRSGKVDWTELKNSYVESDADLIFFSREYSKNPDHPTLATLRNHYYKEGWAHDRSVRIKHEIIESQGKTEALQAEVVQVSLTSREDLRNANRMVERHLQVADATLAIVAVLDAKAIEALEFLDLKQMAIDDPARFIGAMKIIQDMKAGAIEIQRKAIGLAGLKVEFVVQQPDDDKETLQRKLEALQGMDQSELLKSYMEDCKNAAN